MKYKFKVGDMVYVKTLKTHGTIDRLTATLETGLPLYAIKIIRKDVWGFHYFALEETLILASETIDI